MEYSEGMKFLQDTVEKAFIKENIDTVPRIEYYAYLLYNICLNIEKGKIEADEELTLLYKKVTQQISDLNTYVSKLANYVFDEQFKAYFHSAGFYLEKAEQKFALSMFLHKKTALSADFFFDYLLETDLLIMQPEFINLSREAQLKQLQTKDAQKQALDKALQNVFQKKNAKQSAPNRQMLVKLHVYEKEKKIHIINIRGSKGILNLGWEEDNDIQIKYFFVEKHNATLYIDHQRVIFYAISFKRTYVNHQKMGMQNDFNHIIQEVELRNGDVFTLGNNIHFYVEIIDLSQSQKRTCSLCQKEFETSAKDEELCFDCRHKITSELGDFERKIEKENIKYDYFDLHKNDDLKVEIEDCTHQKRIVHHSKDSLKASPKEKPKPEVLQKPKEKKEKEPAFKVGDVIAGYQMVELIGKGGMGEVFHVIERKTGKEFAFKHIIPDVQVDQSKIDLFIRESYIHEQLRHKNIAEVYKVGPINEKPYILMKYYKDGTIMNYFEKNWDNPKVEGLFLDALIQILEGLDYLHNIALDVYVKGEYDKPMHVKGLVHRDIKPANIFVEYDKKGKATMKIADFGLAKSFVLAGMSGVSGTNRISGTFEFMCKQQIIKTIYSKPEADIWSAVATIYYLMTFNFPKPLHPSDSYEVKINKILMCKCTPIRSYNPYISPAFAQIIDRALDDLEQLYYQNAKDLIKDLKKVKL